MKRPTKQEDDDEDEVEPTPATQKEKKLVKVAKPAGLNWYGVGVTILFVLPLVVTGFIYVSKHFFSLKIS